MLYCILIIGDGAEAPRADPPPPAQAQVAGQEIEMAPVHQPPAQPQAPPPAVVHTQHKPSTPRFGSRAPASQDVRLEREKQEKIAMETFQVCNVACQVHPV